MFAELYLTDGTDKIDFLGANKNGSGISLAQMSLSRVQRDPSGIFRQSYGSVLETYDLNITDVTQDAVASRQQQLDRMLEKAQNYIETSTETGLVWLVARTTKETNPRYAVVYGGRIEEYGNVYTQPFAGGLVSTLTDITLGLERSTWQANAPLSPLCLPATTDVTFNPNLATWASVRSLTNVQSLFKTNTGAILAASNLIDRSTDDGGTWNTEATTGTANLRFWQFVQTAAGRIWAVAGLTTGSAGATSGIYYSDNNGDTWTQHTNTVDFYSVVYRSNDDTLFFGGNGEIRYLQGAGSLTVLSTLPTGKVRALCLTQANTVVAGDEYNAWYVPTGQLSLYLGVAEDIGPFLQAVAVEDYVLLGSALYLSISRDEGQTFTIYWRDWGIDAFYLLDNGNLVASQSGSTSTFISYDGGFTWVALATMAAQPTRAWVELNDSFLFAGAANAVYRRIATDAENTYGPHSVGCTDTLMVANHRLESNWTHAFIYDSSANTYTALTPTGVEDLIENSSDQLMFPSPVGTNDAFYVGIQTTVPNAGAFSNLFIQLTDLNYTLVLAVEYWNGAAWTAFASSELRDNTSSLHRSGLLAWHGVGLGSTAVNSVTAYWIRFRVTATGTLSTALPKLSNLYIVQQPFVEIDNIAGDIPALAQVKLFNLIDDGNGNAPSLPTDRVLMGLRSVTRGERFTAYLNLAQGQNPPGVTASVGTEAVFSTDRALAAAGTYVTWTPATPNIWQNVTSIALDGDIMKDFAGTYQVFLRYYFGGFADVVTARILVENFTNQGQVLGESVPVPPVPTADVADLLYLGQITMLPDRYLSVQENTVGGTLRVQFYSTEIGITYAVDCFELILLPADEWIGDFNAPDLVTAAGLEALINVDSATFPKRALRSLLHLRGSELVTSILQSSTSGVFTLQAGQLQRLWFLFCHLNEGDESQGSAHTLVHQVKLWHHARWVGLRGED